MDTWMPQFFQPAQPGFWIVVSIAFWLAIKLTENRWSERHLRWLNMARWVLVPYAGLMAGSLSPRLMGLTGIDWYPTLGIGIILSVAMLALLAIVRFSLPGKGSDKTSAKPGSETSSTSHNRHWTAISMSVLASGAEQFHWSFLRGATWELLLLNQIAIDQPGYWAVWIAALLALPEVLLQPLNSMQRLVKVVILAMTAVLFVFTRNFWLCWMLHAAAWMLLASDNQHYAADQST